MNWTAVCQLSAHFVSGPPAAWRGAISYLKRPRRVSLGAGERRPPSVAPGSRGSQAPFPCACEGKDFVLEAEDPDWGSHCAVCELCGLWQWVLLRGWTELTIPQCLPPIGNGSKCSSSSWLQACEARSSSHFTDKEAEAQRGKGICPWSHSW